MAVQALDFTFNGISLSSINSDFKLVSFDTSPSDTSVDFMNNKVDMSDVNYNSPIVHFYNSTAKDVFEFDIMISKKSGEYLTQNEIRELSSWLTSPVVPKVLSFEKYTEDDDVAVYDNVDFIGVFNKAKYAEMGQSRKMGIGFTFTNISNYAFTKQQTVTINNSAGGTATTTISSIGTKTGLPVYPIIEISPKETGTLFITNTSNPNDTGFGICVENGKDIIIKDFNVYIASSGELYSFDNLTSLKFPYLIDGNNVITVQGKCICTISYRFFENIGI